MICRVQKCSAMHQHAREGASTCPAYLWGCEVDLDSVLTFAHRFKLPPQAHRHRQNAQQLDADLHNFGVICSPCPARNTGMVAEQQQWQSTRLVTRSGLITLWCKPVVRKTLLAKPVRNRPPAAAQQRAISLTDTRQTDAIRCMNTSSGGHGAYAALSAPQLLLCSHS